MNVTKENDNTYILDDPAKATGLFWRAAKLFLGEVVRLGMPFLIPSRSIDRVFYRVFY